MIIAWWSAGVTSAVATKLAIEEYGVDNVVPIYFAIDSANPDNARFKQQCEEWYGREIITERAPPKYKDQFDVILNDNWVFLCWLDNYPEFLWNFGDVPLLTRR